MTEYKSFHNGGNKRHLLRSFHKYRHIPWQNAKSQLSEKFIKHLHFILKTGTSDAKKDWFAVGDYKKLPNEVGGNETTLPEDVSSEIKKLLADYNGKENVTLEDIIEFHVRFERIHPFQDGNGRIGRLIMFKECLKHNIVPFIIEDKIKMFYYRGLKEWNQEKGYLTDTCLSAQDIFKNYLDYFRILYWKKRGEIHLAFAFMLHLRYAHNGVF